MSESIDEDLVIKDIDSPLYKYLFFYRIDINNCFVNGRQNLVQKIKSNILDFFIKFATSTKAILSNIK